MCCPVAGYLRVPIATVVKWRLSISLHANGPRFALSVCCFFSETGQRKAEFTRAGWLLAGPQGRHLVGVIGKAAEVDCC